MSIKSHKRTFRKLAKQTPHERQRLDRNVQRSARDEQQPTTSLTAPPPIPPHVTVADAFANARQRVNAVRGLIERVNGGPDWIERLHDRYHNPAGRIAAGDSTSSLSTHLVAIFNTNK